MKEKIIEALALAKKFYNEELEGNYVHSNDELTRYYQLEDEIANELNSFGYFGGWYGAICELKDALRFE